MGFSFFTMSCVHFGNEKIISSERTLNSFEKIHVSGTANVRFHISQDYRAVVTVDSNLEKYVELTVRDKTLNIGTRNGGSFSFTEFTVDVYCPGLTGVSVSGSGDFTAIDKITAAAFESRVSGSGKLIGTIECDDFSVTLSGSGKMDNIIICSNFSAHISGSGKITVSGTGNDLDIRISGSGDFIGLEYQTNNASARISGSGNMDIWVLEYLEANVSGSGNIRYRGNPRLTFSGSGSGRISNI
jgi:hypothetical protein